MNAPQADTARPATSKIDQTLLGLGLMTLGFLCYSVADACAKGLSGQLHPIQIAWFRQTGLLAVALWMLSRQGPRILRTRRPVLQLLRGFAAAASATCFITSVRYVPLADSVAVSFVAPFVVTVLGALVLREPVGRRRWIAVAIGLAGTLIVIRPGLGMLHPAILLVVVAASLFALRQILSRLIGTVDSTQTTIAYSALTSVLLLTVPMLFVWRTPVGGTTIGLLCLIALAAGIGEFFVIRALELAQAVVLAPLQYSMILWSTTFGWLFFSQLPDHWTLIGAAIICGSGLYTLHRERLAIRERRRAAMTAERLMPR